MIRITRNDDINFNVDEIHGKGDRYNITFYTVNNSVNIVKHDTDVHDGIIVLNGSELMTLGEGVLNLRVDNIAPNAGYNDGVYNSSFTKTTKYYIQAGIIVPDGSDTQTVIEIVGELQDALNGEITRSTNKDNAHDADIANEATARANADSALSDRITANATAITNEATARANADNALSDSITANATAIANTYTKQEVDDMLDGIDIVLPDNIVIDANYTHTDNNYTTTDKNKLAGIAIGAEVNVQSDWAVTDTRSDAYINHKPTKVSDFTNDAGYLTSYTETDPTVPSWAKQPTKPAYTASEVGALSSSTVIPSKTSDLTNDSGYISADDAQLLEYKEYDDPDAIYADSPDTPTIGYYVGPIETLVGIWDGGFWNMLPTSYAIDVTIDSKLNRQINWVSSVGIHNQANSPLNVNHTDTYVIMDGVSNSGNSTMYIQCNGIAGAAQQSECIIYFDCTSAAKSINWKNTISWVNDAPAFENGKIYEVSLCLIGNKWLGVYTEYASSVAMSNNQN